MKNSTQSILVSYAFLLPSLMLLSPRIHAASASSLAPMPINYQQQVLGSLDEENLTITHLVTGPFFNPQQAVALKVINTCCDQYNDESASHNSHLDDWVGPQVIEIKHDEQRVDLFSHIHASVDGFCVSNTNQQLGILIREGSDAPAAIDQFRYLLLYDANTSHFDKVRFDQVNRWQSEEFEQAPQYGDDLIRCEAGQDTLPDANGPFIPCRCNMTLIEEIKALESLLYSIEGSNDLILNSSDSLTERDETNPLHFATVLPSTLEKIKSFSRSQFVNAFSFKEVVTDQLQVVVFSYWKPIYETHSRVMVKSPDDKNWKLIYSAYPNSQGFSPPVFDKVIDDKSVQLLMCSDGCDWQNGERSVAIQLSRDDDDYYMSVRKEIDLQYYREQVDALIASIKALVQ